MAMPGRGYLVNNSYRYGYNNQEKSIEIGPNGNNMTAEFWQYDTRLGRRWNVDPVTTPYESFYAVNSNSPIWSCDPKGSFDSRKEARQYRKSHDLKGRIQIMQDGYYSIVDKDSKTLWFKDHTDQKVYSSPIFTSKTKSTLQKNMSPFDIGVEWLTGTGRKSREFKNGDLTVELYKQAQFYKEALKETKSLLNNWQEGQLLPEKSFPYELNGWEGVVKYLRDYSTLLTFGQTGNLMYTYLGSHSLYMTVKSIDVKNRVALVEFIVHNTSTLESATRIPKIGYEDWYIKSAGNFWNSVSGRTGPTSETEQIFKMDETIKF